MKEFIDLQGASGAYYRFRLWREGAAHSPIAGNYVVVRDEPGGLTVLQAGATNDLSLSRSEWQETVRRNPEACVYTRLNIARTARQAEHDDIMARVTGAPGGEPRAETASQDAAAR